MPSVFPRVKPRPHPAGATPLPVGFWGLIGVFFVVVVASDHLVFVVPSWDAVQAVRPPSWRWGGVQWVGSARQGDADRIDY